MKNTTLFIQENEFENDVCKMTAILSRLRCVNNSLSLDVSLVLSPNGYYLPSVKYSLTWRMYIKSTRVPFQYPIRRLIVRSHEVWKQLDWFIELSHHFEIWQAPRQHCCRGAFLISERYCPILNTNFETSWGLTINCLIGYWNRARINKIHLTHDDVIKWKYFLRYWPFVRGIHRSPVNSPRNGQWRGALMHSLIFAWINGWVNNREAGGMRRHGAHYDLTVVCQCPFLILCSNV